MVVSTTKVKQAMGLTPKPKPKPTATSVPELLKLVEELQSRESRLKAELAELNHRNHKSTSLVLALESNLVTKTRQAETLLTRVAELEAENKELINERVVMNAEFESKVRDYDVRIVELISEVEHLSLSSQRYLGLVQVTNKSNLIKNLGLKKSALAQSISLPSSSSSENLAVNSNVDDVVKFDCSTVVELAKDCYSSRVPRVPKPPPKRCFSKSGPPSPPGLVTERTSANPPPPPPPPGKCRTAKVKRVPEVVEFYHSLMRRDSRKENGAGIAEVTMTAAARDLVGEIENRSAYSLTIKLASVKLAMKFMKRVLAELEIVCRGPEEEELIVQGVRFAFRVHQFAGGFDVETMTAFEELRDKARAYHIQGQNQQQQRLACNKSMSY